MIDEKSFVGGILFSLFIASVITFVIATNCTGNTIESVNFCQTACKNNEGMRKIYVSGSCDCKNGASFSWQEINKEKL